MSVRLPAFNASAMNGRGQGREVPTATKEDLELVRTVFQIVARQFYQDQHAILIDILSKSTVMPAETLAKALGISIKEMLQITHQLTRDGLIKVHRRMESKESGPSNYLRPTPKSYLYLESKKFLDATKWKLMKMRSQIDSVLRNELDNKGYMCPRCGKAYSTLDVAALLDPVTMLTFICDMPGCGSELVDNEDAEDVRRSRDRLQRFNEQCGPILDRLRKIDTIALPHFDLMTEISKKGDADAWVQRALQRQNPAGPRGAIGTATGGALPGPSIAIDMYSTNPEGEAQRRLERESEAARMRQENALPVWLQETQDPRAQRLRAQGEEEGSSLRIDVDAAQNGESQNNADQEDHLAQYASMLQEEEAEEEEDGDLDLEIVTDTRAASSKSATPQTAGKRSREESSGNDDHDTSKRVKEDEDEDNYDLEEVA